VAGLVPATSIVLLSALKFEVAEDKPGDHAVCDSNATEIGVRITTLERDDFSSNRHPAPAYCWSMIFSENPFPLFGIML